jgi:hypothetical protein
MSEARHLFVAILMLFSCSVPALAETETVIELRCVMMKDEYQGSTLIERKGPFEEFFWISLISAKVRPHSEDKEYDASISDGKITFKTVTTEMGINRMTGRITGMVSYSPGSYGWWTGDCARGVPPARERRF